MKRSARKVHTFSEACVKSTEGGRADQEYSKKELIEIVPQRKGKGKSRERKKKWID